MFHNLSHHQNRFAKILSLPAFLFCGANLLFSANYWVDGLDADYLNDSANWDGNTLSSDSIAPAAGYYAASQYSTTYGNNYCWATSASNVLQWWQNRHAAFLPAGTPNGIAAGDTSHFEITNTLMSSFENTGGASSNAIQWYLTGTYDAASGSQLRSDNTNAGGYWKDYVTDSDISSLLKLTTAITTYTVLEEALDDAFDKGAAMTLSMNSTSGGHTITIWGAERGYDDVNGLERYLALYVSDSATSYGTITRAGIDYTKNSFTWNGVTTDLSVAELDYRGYSLNSLTTFYNGDELFPSIPEPSLFGILAGTLALALAGTRRRRK